MFTRSVAKFGITKADALSWHMQNDTSDVAEVRERFIKGVLERDGSKLLTKDDLLTLCDAQLCKSCVSQGTSQWGISAYFLALSGPFESILRSSGFPRFNTPSRKAQL